MPHLLHAYTSLCAVQRDAILKVTSTAICGSDLHMYMGAMPGMRKGDLLGHEVGYGYRLGAVTTDIWCRLVLFVSCRPQCASSLHLSSSFTYICSSWASWRTWAPR
jgi:Zn-dependent alcohol dehydrogenase